MRKSHSAGSASDSGRRRVADERRNSARSASDHDVLRSRALEPAGVDEDVEEVADEREHRGEDVHGRREERERDRREQDPELERLLGRDATGRDGTLFRAAAHERVDVAVEHVVQSRRAAARQREPEHRHGEQSERRDALRADEHSRRAGEEKQRHDPRLRQREVVACGGERRRLAAEALRRRRRALLRTRSPRARRGAPSPTWRRRSTPRRRPGAIATRNTASATTVRRTSDGYASRASTTLRDEERQRDESDSPVRRSELEHRADDDQPDRDGARDGGHPEQHARRDRRVARPVRARHAAHAASSGGRSGALRWSRTAPRRSCAAAAGTSRTTPAYPPARGRSPRALRFASSSAR